MGLIEAEIILSCFHVTPGFFFYVTHVRALVDFIPLRAVISIILNCNCFPPSPTAESDGVQFVQLSSHTILAAAFNADLLLFQSCCTSPS